jgi:ribosome-associated heat shock protein Hsp15
LELKSGQFLCFLPVWPVNIGMVGQGQDTGPVGDSNAQCRLDLWLWAVRIYKTRSQAATACRGGKVRVNGQNVKPARLVRAGDRIEVRRGAVTRQLEVREVLASRVGAKIVENYLIDHTPVEVYQEASRLSKERRLAQPVREEGKGRPTKKDRRAWSRAAEKAADREAAISELMRKSVDSSGEE